MKWLVRKVLTLFRVKPDADRTLARHNATIRRADRLLRVVHDYDRADAFRRR